MSLEHKIVVLGGPKSGKTSLVMTKGLQKASCEDYKEVADKLEIEEYDIGSNEKLKLNVIDTPSDILLDEIR